MKLEILTKDEFETKCNEIISMIQEIKDQINEGNKQEFIEEKIKWINKKDAAKMLDVCTKTIDTYMRKGLLPYSQFKSKLYIKPGDIENLINNNYKIKTNV